MKWMLALLSLLGASLLAAAPPAFPGATAQYRAWIAADLPGSPEGLALDAKGNLYAAVAASGEIFRLEGHGKYRRVASVMTGADMKGGRVWGLRFAHDGYLYAAYVWNYSEADEMNPLHPACKDPNDHSTGIYRIDVKSGAVTPWLTKRMGWPVCFPDDIAVDAEGDLYVTDLTLAGVWKLKPDRQFELWSKDALLQWPPAPYAAAPEGANDLELSHDGRSLYVVTDGAPALIRIPILADGAAGAAVEVAGSLSPLDGITLDESGNIYVSEILRSEISVFSPDGAQRIVIATAQTAPLINPTSLVFHDGVLCAANLGWDVRPAPRSVACMSGFKRPNRTPP